MITDDTNEFIAAVSTTMPQTIMYPVFRIFVPYFEAFYWDMTTFNNTKEETYIFKGVSGGVFVEMTIGTGQRRTTLAESNIRMWKSPRYRSDPFVFESNFGAAEARIKSNHWLDLFVEETMGLA